MEIIIYGTPECGQCRATKRKLKDYGYHPIEVDLSDPANEKILLVLKAKYGDPLKLPVVRIRDRGTFGEDKITDEWQGYRPDKLIPLAP